MPSIPDIPDELKQKAAMAMLESGVATVAEVARLRGVTKQYFHGISRDLQPRKIRERYLETIWDKLLTKLS